MLKEVKKLARNVMTNSSRASEIGAKYGSAPVSRNPKAGLSVPDGIFLYHTGTGVYLRKFVYVHL